MKIGKRTTKDATPEAPKAETPAPDKDGREKL
jgi:hypothetical protein